VTCDTRRRVATVRRAWGGRRAASRATSENSASRHGVERVIARSDHWRWVSHKARYILPPALGALGYMLYRARGAYFQDGFLTVHNSDFRQDRKFVRLTDWERPPDPGAARTWKGARMSAAGPPGRCAIKTAILSNAASIAAASREQSCTISILRLSANSSACWTYQGLVEFLISEEEHRLGILPGGYSPSYEEVVKTFGSTRRQYHKGGDS
jgi:hypothetical protein